MDTLDDRSDAEEERSSAIIDLQVDIHLLAVIELADGLGIALVPVELGVNIVVDIG